MNGKTPIELEAEHVERLEQIREKLTDQRATWEKREGSHLGAAEMLAHLDTTIETNTNLLELAREHLERISAQPSDER